MFGKNWQSAHGVVINSQLSGGYGSPDSTQREFVIEVTTPAGEVFRAKVGQPRNSTNFWDPRIGQKVLVEFDPESRKVRFDKKDPGINAKLQIKANESKFDADLNGPPGTPSR
ncbi:MAG: hypothetical protein JWN96_1869 [Mycobacterium sp.]|jgi:hypothetical protein|nr:hypothetical protein [Mycobacterium sp.]